MGKLGRKDFISIRDFSKEELYTILELCKKQKPLARNFSLEPTHPGRVLACIFHKPSLRTRISFEIAIRQLGGSSLYITDKEIGIGHREAPKDVGEVLSRYVDAIMIRTFDHRMVEELAANARVPVINGLTDLLHPCQIMGDIMTIVEHLGTIEGKKVVFVGDGNNVAHSLLYGCSKMGAHIVVATPEGYEPREEVVARAAEEGRKNGCTVTVTNDPQKAVKGADVVYTDVWTSMGQEKEKEERLKLFQPYQINPQLVKGAKEDYIFMHCLPAHRGEEVVNEVADSINSVIFDQAENRMHTQKALMALTM
ncbi:MAG: ornithine carbamoyltransferase [Candidatus Krumholzibacteria bacterium]|nr:ornithine carbamoyltransferase [Candidatus Krumholzibacteria bacterium]